LYEKKIKQKIMIPFFIVLILLTVSLMGCYERVEMQGFKYDENTSTVTLEGSAPNEDPVRRQILSENGEPIVEFRFYEKITDKWDEEYRTFEKDDYNKENERTYFTAEIKDLDPNAKYYVRALAYYYDPWGELESGWGYSDMFTFTPSKPDSSNTSITINQKNINNIWEILDKNPSLKHIIIKHYEIDGYDI
jgi:hypothetical protein